MVTNSTVIVSSKQQPMYGTMNDAALAGEIVVAFLAGFYLREQSEEILWAEGRLQKMAAALDRSAAQSAVHPLPTQCSWDHLPRPERWGREPFSHRPGRRER